MLTCAECHEHLLDFVYELLDDGDSDRVKTHLQSCASCQAALVDAQRQQGLFAKAALFYHALPRFEAPREVMTPDAAETLPLPCLETTVPESVAAPAAVSPARKPARLWPWLACAAAILVAVGFGFTRYQDELHAHRQSVAQAKQAVAEIDAQLIAHRQEAVAKQAALPQQVRAGHLRVQLDGPAFLQTDAASQFRVTTRDLAGKPAAGEVTVSLREADRAPLYTATLASSGEIVAMIPPGQQITESSRLRLEVSARGQQGSATLNQTIAPDLPEFVTQIVTSKSHYLAGEVLFFRTLTLQRYSLQPPGLALELQCSLVSAAGREVAQLKTSSQPNGIGGGEFAVTPGLPVGHYTLQVREVNSAARTHRFLAQEHPLEILHLQAADLAFDQQQYRPNEKVQATLRANRPEIANQAVTVTPRYFDNNNREVGKGKTLQTRTDNYGNANFEWQIPKVLPSPDVKLEVEFHDGKPNVKLLQDLHVVVPATKLELFPESGDLIAGVPNRIYYRLTMPDMTAAGSEGQLLDEQGKVLQQLKHTDTNSVASSRQQLGVFTLTPQSGKTYKVHWPIRARPALEQTLPTALSEGVVLQAVNVVAPEGEPLQLKLSAAKPTPVFVVASCRGRIVDQQFLEADASGTAVTLRPVAGANGVLRLTVYRPTDTRLQPLAERLLYRQPREHLHVQLTTPKADQPLTATAGRRAELGVNLTTERGDKADGWLLAAVVDTQTRSQDQAANRQGPPAYFHVATALRHPASLEDSQVLLRDTPAARQALDYFLATQGWRRFVVGDGMNTTILAKAPPAAQAPVAPGERTVLVHQDNLAALTQKIETDYQTRLAKLTKDYQDRQAAMKQSRDERAAAAHTAALALYDHEQRPQEYLRYGAGVLLLLLLALGLLLLCWGLGRTIQGKTAATLQYGGAFAVIAVGLLSYLMTAGLRQAPSGFSPDQSLTHKALPDLPVLQLSPLVAARTASPRGGLVSSAGQAESMKQRGETKEVEAAAAVTAMFRPSMRRFALPRADADREMMRVLGDAKGAGQAGGSGVAPLAGNSQMNMRYQKNLLEQGSYGAKQDDSATKSGVAMNTPMPALRPTAAPPTVSDPQLPTLPPRQAPGGVNDTAKQPLAPVQPVMPVPLTPPGPQAPGLPPYVFLSNEQQREYATQNAVVREFYDVLLWHPALTTSRGQAQFSFDLPPYANSYQIILQAHSPSGRLGYAEQTLQAK